MSELGKVKAVGFSVCVPDALEASPTCQFDSEVPIAELTEPPTEEAKEHCNLGGFCSKNLQNCKTTFYMKALYSGQSCKGETVASLWLHHQKEATAGVLRHIYGAFPKNLGPPYCCGILGSVLRSPSFWETTV